MHPFPLDLDLSPLIGMQVGHISFLRYEVSIDLWPDACIGRDEQISSVRLESDWALVMHGEQIDCLAQYQAREGSQLNRLFGKRILAASVVRSDQICFEFEGAIKLKASTDVGGYESVHLSINGVAHVF